MFSNNNNENENESDVNVEIQDEKETLQKTETEPVNSKYKSILSNPNIVSLYSSHAISSDKMDTMLEKEKQHNKTESWNKLDKTQKIQKLNKYAEKYVKENKLSQPDMKSLKLFFIDCLEKNKLQKAKDVLYDKESQEITGVPALFYHSLNRNFTLRVVDPKRVSTLKCLTPRKPKQLDIEKED